MTPAQQAREFAEQHDIVIRSVGRRYQLFGPNSELIDEVGGYPAALNAMKRYIGSIKVSDVVQIDIETVGLPGSELAAGGTLVLSSVKNLPPVSVNEFVGTTPEQDAAARVFFGVETKEMHCDVVREDGAMGVDADRVILDGIELMKQQRVADVLNRQHVEEQLLHEIRMLSYDALMQLIKMATGATLDKIARAKGWAPRGRIEPNAYHHGYPWPDQDFRVQLLSTATTVYCDAPIVMRAEPYHDYANAPSFTFTVPVKAPGESDAEFTRRVSAICENNTRRFMPVKMRYPSFVAWVEYAQPDRDGETVYTCSFDTRPDALKWIRQQLSGKQGKHIIGQSINRVGV